MLARKPARRAMQFHEVANIFPMMSVEEFDALQKDIEANGLREAIWTYQGKILDGRNRYQACLNLKIEPKFREWDGKGDVVAFVVSLNLHRRHLNESQRAMIAESLVKSKEGRPAKTASIEAVSQDKAAQLLNVSRSAVQRAAKVARHGDQSLISAVREGEIPVSTAAKAVDAAERYPAIARIVSRPQDRAAIAENLDRLPEPEREKKIAQVLRDEEGVLETLANKPPMPKKAPPAAEDLWRDFFDDSERALNRFGVNNTFEKYFRGWEYEEKEWFLERLRDFIATLNDVEATALRSMDYDEGAEGAISTTAVH
jgi:predicted DNA-binding protein (UPF0251 family)